MNWFHFAHITRYARPNPTSELALKASGKKLRIRRTTDLLDVGRRRLSPLPGTVDPPE